MSSAYQWQKYQRLVPVACLLMGVPLGYMVTYRTDRSAGTDAAAKSRDVPVATNPAVPKKGKDDHNLPKGESPIGPVESRQKLIREQFSNPHSVHTDDGIWLPKAVVRAFTWDLGSVGAEVLTLSDTASEVLDLTTDQKELVETKIAKFLNLIHNAELAHAKRTAHSDSHVEIKIPKGIDISREKATLKADLVQALGEDKAEFLLPALFSKLAGVTPLLTNESWVVNIEVDDSGRTRVTTVRESGTKIDYGRRYPEYLRHLVELAPEETNK